MKQPSLRMECIVVGPVQANEGPSPNELKYLFGKNTLPEGRFSTATEKPFFCISLQVAHSSKTDRALDTKRGLYQKWKNEDSLISPPTS